MRKKIPIKPKTRKIMKVAIASSGNDKQALLSEVLARSPWVVFYDTLTGALEFFPNPYSHNENEVGHEILQVLISRNVSLVISRRVGKKLKQWLDARQIQLAIFTEHLTIGQVLELLGRKSSKV
jgi:predicted Fe-Mo cluster-binding NifX family protein